MTKMARQILKRQTIDMVHTKKIIVPAFAPSAMMLAPFCTLVRTTRVKNETKVRDNSFALKGKAMNGFSSGLQNEVIMRPKRNVTFRSD